MRAGLGLLVGILLSMLVARATGESGFHVAGVIFNSAFGSWDDFAMVLYYASSLLFTGLSVSIAFHAGLFNIGAEGQLTVGAVAATSVGIFVPQIPYPFAPFIAAMAGILAGSIWGMIPGALKAFRGSHEVINTMMMNFIAAGLMTWALRGFLRNPESMNTESASVGTNYLLQKGKLVASVIPNSPFNTSFTVAVVVAALMHFFLFKTVWGYELRVVGQNDEAAEINGINPRKYKILAMMIAGSLASLVCMNEVFGSAGRLKDGFSPGYGFTGIAVALLARNNPLGIIASAILFGILQKGAIDLDFETKLINKDFAKIIQAIILFSVASFYFFDTSRLKNYKRKFLGLRIWKIKV